MGVGKKAEIVHNGNGREMEEVRTKKMEERERREKSELGQQQPAWQQRSELFAGCTGGDDVSSTLWVDGAII
jgi:hypothetical protein